MPVISKTLRYSFYACVRNLLKIVTFVIEKMKLTLVNVNAPVVATELVVAFFSTGGGLKGKKSIPDDFMIYL